MIRSAGDNFLCSVELFYEDQPNQLVRKYKRRERPYEVCPLSQTLVDAIGSADYHYDVSAIRKEIVDMMR